jgi:hypothetical protein
MKNLWPRDWVEWVLYSVAFLAVADTVRVVVTGAW